jgi:phosphate transport system substrate-binding protein
MKQNIITIVCLVLLVFFTSCTGQPANDTVTLSGAFALYPLAVRWKEAYARVKPGIKIEVAAGGAGKGMTDALGGLVDIAMVSRDVNQAETDQGAIAFAVAKDAVIPMINSRNPAAEILRVRGMTPRECAAVWITGTIKTWNQVKGVSNPGVINVYTRSDACGAGEVWAKFLGGKAQDALGGVQVSGDPGLAEAVVRDDLGIGYNNINFAYDAKTLKPVEGLEVLKLDFNANGRIDPEEDVYATRTDLVTAIREGKFPSPPARNLFFVTKGRPVKTAVRDFIIWALTEGQRYIDESGYIKVKDVEIGRCLEILRAE